MVLSLFLSIGTVARSQTLFMDRNSDGSISASVVLETFRSYIDDAETDLPKTDEETELFISDFFHKIPLDNDGYFTIRFGDADAPELTPQDVDNLVNKCGEILEKKKEQVSQQQEEKQPKKASTVLESIDSKTGGNSGKLIVIVAVVLVIAIIVILILVKSKKKRNNNVVPTNYGLYPENNTNDNAPSDVIIRKKTTSIMYKQSLDNVVKDGNYMTLNCSDFCNDTAVKTMYIKNTCIMDIYNMYANDLRNPNNPKEDGCMVLGRWVHDEKNDEYAVSLEEVVFPGDDAVFAEYELDFGGKIKVKLNERLRKLRRETELQYDLTCWVHSHPGLGVFFSNTDCSLHLLHKHPTHPKFLTAIVIDILTPQQELGIFTFNHSMGINSRAELKQLYSLEEWYKWAVESKRTAVNYEDHYNALENAKMRNDKFHDILLSNSVIIDIDKIITSQNREELYFVHGFSIQKDSQTTYTTVKIDNSDTLTDNELIGCFVAVTHRSYPTIKNMVAAYLNKVSFVLVYSIADGMLTTIPIVANDLCADESYYGEQPLEELKIWVRRKR